MQFQQWQGQAARRRFGIMVTVGAMATAGTMATAGAMALVVAMVQEISQ